MSILTKLGSAFDGASLGGALLAALIGTGLLLYFRIRSAASGGFIPSLRLLAKRLTAATTGTAAPAPPAARQAPASQAGEETPREEQEGAALGPSCPPELSRRIDRIEAKLRARSAKRSG